MEKQRATALPNSPTPPQLWGALGSKLNQSAQGRMPSKQRVAGSNPARDAISYESTPFPYPTDVNRATFNVAAQLGLIDCRPLLY